MIQLYYSPGTASLAPHFLLKELGTPFQLVLVDTTKKDHQQEAYLKLNPKGKIPLLIDGDLHLTESAAICMYIADAYGASSSFSIPNNPASRAKLTQWMLYLSNTLQAELLSYFYPERLTDNEESAAQVKKHAELRIADMLQYIDEQLNNSRGDFLLGEHITIADLFLFMLCRWTRGMQKPARDYPHLKTYLALLFQRPSIMKIFNTEEIAAPYY